MIDAYLAKNAFLQKHEITSSNLDLIKDALWIDLLNPTTEDEKVVETSLLLDIPTKEDMQEIELSSRLYKESHTLFMTATMLINSETQEPTMDAITFILTKKQLITVRYYTPQSFLLFFSRLNRRERKEDSAYHIFIELLESAIDRIADILERVGCHVDQHSQIIFRPKLKEKIQSKIDFQQILQEIGANGDLGAKARESLISFNRIVSYFVQNGDEKLDDDLRLRLATLTKDIRALSDHVNFLSNQVNFLLNATLGMINIEQSNIIKIFSIAAVIFLPPTLVASIYGMNFDFMP